MTTSFKVTRSPRKRAKQVIEALTFVMAPRLLSDRLFWFYSGALFYKLSGIPTSLDIHLPPTVLQIRLSICHYLFIVIIMVLNSMWLSIEAWEPSATVMEQYFYWMMMIFWWSVLVIILRFIYRCKDIHNIQQQWVAVEEDINDHYVKHHSWVKYLQRITLIMFTFFGFIETISSLQIESTLTYKHQMFNGGVVTVFIITFIALPLSVLPWALVHNVVSGLILQMKFSAVTVFSMMNKCRAEDINTVLPVVEVDQRVIFHLPGPGRSSSTHRCSPWYCRLLHCQDMVRTYLKVKDIKLKEDKLNAHVTSYMLILFSCFAGLSFLSWVAPEDKFGAEYLTKGNATSTWFNIMCIVVYTSPILFYQWNKHRTRSSVVETCKEMFATPYPEMRKVFGRLIIIASDNYLDNCWWYFDLDYSLCQTILEIIVLTGTTFVVTQG